MTTEIIMAIALLCQTHPSVNNTTTNADYSPALVDRYQTACQAELLECMEFSDRANKLRYCVIERNARIGKKK